MLPSASEIEYFLEVCRSLNITRASERLGVSQPTLTISLRKLENRLGAALLIRRKNGVELTRFGLKFESASKVLLEQWRKVQEIATREETLLRGRYSIGVHPAVAIYSLPTNLAQLMFKNPELELQLVHDLSRKITEQIIRSKVDIGIVVNPIAHPDLVIQKWGEDFVTFWKAPKLKNENVVIYDPDLKQSSELLARGAKAGIQFEREIHSNSLQVIQALVEAGTGVGILPSRVARPSGSKLSMLQNDLRVADKIALVYRPELRTTEAGRILIDSLRFGGY